MTLVPSELKEAVQFFSSDLPHPVMFSIENSDWVRKWKSVSTPGTSTAIIAIIHSRVVNGFIQCSSIESEFACGI